MDQESKIRNPMLGLPSADKIRLLPEESRRALAMLLRDLSKDSRARAEKSWKKHKAPMAAYWKAVSVYAGHTARILR